MNTFWLFKQKQELSQFRLFYLVFTYSFASKLCTHIREGNECVISGPLFFILTRVLCCCCFSPPICTVTNSIVSKVTRHTRQTPFFHPNHCSHIRMLLLLFWNKHFNSSLAPEGLALHMCVMFGVLFLFIVSRLCCRLYPQEGSFCLVFVCVCRVVFRGIETSWLGINQMLNHINWSSVWCTKWYTTNMLCVF